MNDQDKIASSSSSPSSSSGATTRKVCNKRGQQYILFADIVELAEAIDAD